MTDPRRGGGWRTPAFTLAVVANTCAVMGSGAPWWAAAVSLGTLWVAWYVGVKDEKARSGRNESPGGMS